VEVAFFGGSFTRLPRELQYGLLKPLEPLVRSGEVSSIRVSTRPDALDPATVGFLAVSGVSLVELGVQSMDDRALQSSGRGHTAQDAVDAFASLRAAGLRVGAQMMPGLPGERAADAVVSFRRVLSLRPDLLRIYPALVLHGTELARMYQDGRYRPLQLEDAVDLCKTMLHDAARAGIPVVRVGLQPTDGLSRGAVVVAGPYHPALRQLAEGERWFDLLRLVTRDISSGEVLTIYTSRSEVSDVVGQKRKNIIRLENISGARVAGVYADESLPAGMIRIAAGSRRIHGDLLRDLDYTAS
jgi:histone acetyltransferase (RNA polymerase elongator complex component)